MQHLSGDDGQGSTGSVLDNTDKWSKQCRSAKVALLRTASSPSRGLVKAVMETERPTDVHALRLAIITAVRPRAKQDSVDTAIAIASRVRDAEIARDSERARARWDAKCRQMLKGAMSEAHRWTNQPNKPKLSLEAPGL